jgi:hypothetical protein
MSRRFSINANFRMFSLSLITDSKSRSRTDILLKSAIYVELLVGSQFLDDERLLIWSGTLARVANRVKSLMSSLCTLEQPFYGRRQILDFTSGGIDLSRVTLKWRTMTRLVIRETQTVAGPNPPLTEVPQLDERLWQAWIEKNERLDKVRFARRVKIIAILVLIFGVFALMLFVG